MKRRTLLKLFSLSPIAAALPVTAKPLTVNKPQTLGPTFGYSGELSLDALREYEKNVRELVEGKPSKLRGLIREK